MFIIVKKQTGTYIPIDIKDATSNFNKLTFISNKQEQSFRILQGYDCPANTMFCFKFLDDFLILKKNSNDITDTILKERFIDIHNHIQNNFGFNIIEILTYFSQELTNTQKIIGFSVVDKNNNQFPVDIELDRFGNVSLHGNIPLKSPNYKSPKLLGKFLKDNTLILGFPVIDPERRVATDDAIFKKECSNSSLIESIEFLSISLKRSIQGEYHKSMKIETTILKDTLKINIKVDDCVDSKDIVDAVTIQDRFKFEIALMQRILDCYQNNKKRLKDVELLTEKQFEKHQAEQETANKERMAELDS